MRSTLRCCKSIKRCALGFEFPWASGAGGSIPCSPESSMWLELLAAQAAEDGERIARLDLIDELAARLDLAVQAGCQGVGILAARGADDEVVEAPLGHVTLGLELIRKLTGLLARSALDAHLPRGEATLELFLLPRLARRLVVPAVLLVEPMLDPARSRLHAVLAQLRLDERVSLLGRRAGGRVDVDGVVVARDREPVSLQVVSELTRLGAEVACKPVEEAGGVLLFLDLDPDAPVVVRHRLSLVCTDGLARALRARRGALRSRRDAGARRAPAGAARELGLGGGTLAADGG